MKESAIRIDKSPGSEKNGNIPAFVREAGSFADRHGRRFVFRLLKGFMGCDDTELRFVICKIYCLSIRSSQRNKENTIKTLFGLLFLPFYAFVTKELIWKREERVQWNFETTDSSYFNTRFAAIYDSLKGSRRLTPRDPGTFQRDDLSKGIFSSMGGGKAMRLLLYSLAAYVPLVAFCLRTRLNIMRAYREAMSVYVSFDSYFTRYPCVHYMTYADDTNHPSRYIAFRKSCPGKLIVIQNGERSYQPSWSFGMMDYYLTFGEAYIRMARELSYWIEEAFPVGSLALNQHFGKLPARDGWKEFDILYIDNGSLSPPDYGGLEEVVARSEENIFLNLNEFKLRHQECRIAFQLRHYGDPRRREHVIGVLERIFNGGITILDNDGAGASYKNIMKAKLVLTFQSTMGFESMMLGAKTLFINYSGDESETLCSDVRFQIDDVDHDYGYFEGRIKRLLSMEDYSIPEIAYERHYSFDGRVQDRIIDILRTRLTES